VVRELAVRLVEGVTAGGRVGRVGPLVEAVGAPAREDRARGLSGLAGALGTAHLTEAAGAAVAVGLVTQPGVLALQFPDASCMSRRSLRLRRRFLDELQEESNSSAKRNPVPAAMIRSWPRLKPVMVRSKS
jgi:hypothetical protein